MKLKFTITYRTSWGESLHVAIDFHSSDGAVRHQNMAMLTEDGEHWTLEMSALVSRLHPLSHIVYRYQVEVSPPDTDPGSAGGDSVVVRREWDLVPRVYHFDASQSYLFPDSWRDRPLPYHLYSNAYLTTVGGRLDEHVEPVAMPLFRRTVIFRVSAPQVRPGQAVAVCGSHPAIGSWNTSRYQRMQYIGQHDWMLSVDAMGWLLPIEYKYVVVDSETHAFVQWEEGDNRVITDGLDDGQALVLYGGQLRVCEETWRVAGVAVPVFSLRSDHSYGVGDFGDLRRLVDWAAATGMRVIQLLPVNDTTTRGHWTDSCPYNIVSCFALHPHYVDLEAAGTLRSKARMTQFLRRRQELNALSYSDYEAVDRVKSEYLRALFEEQGKAVMDSKEFKAFVSENEEWLKPYAEWMNLPPHNLITSFVYFVQYLLHQQLKSAADYARSKGIVVKGDLPVGVSRDSAEAHEHPEYFHLDSQAGVPPDRLSPHGQNWGFPTYHWSEPLFRMQRKRLRHLSRYFDALRIDHILGYFRVWEIPDHALYSELGHFSPSLPLTVDEIEYFGLPFRKELFTRPFISDHLLDRLFGLHANYVREHFLVSKAYNLYDLKEEYSTQRLVADSFAGRRDENSLWIRDGLLRLISNVLFVEDPRQTDMYHPRVAVINEPVFEALNVDEKDAFMRLYNNYYYQRHTFFWGQNAMRLLTSCTQDSRMLLCAEDLGMLPDCVEPVLDQLRILPLEVQQMPKQSGFEFAHLDANPVRSVCTVSTHDMAPLRLWWQEQPERRQRYYVSMLQKEGRAPEQLPVHLAEEVIARHLYCPSMLCILSLQDWLAMDSELRCKHPEQERVNTPGDATTPGDSSPGITGNCCHWQYRMHLTIEELLTANRFNNKVRTMITRSKR